MKQEVSDKIDGVGLRVAVVVSRYNEVVTRGLRDGAWDALVGHGVRADDITEVWVPGAWEIPLTVKSLAESRRYDAVVALGCVIRGETTHHLYIAGEAARGTAQAALETNVPVGFGILTTETEAQAVERSGAGQGNKGVEAALSAIEMVRVLRRIGGKDRSPSGS